MNCTRESLSLSKHGLKQSKDKLPAIRFTLEIVKCQGLGDRTREMVLN